VQQTSAAARLHYNPGSLFVTDKVTKFRFLIVTGLVLCVYPRKLIPQRKTRVNYDLCAANGITIPTYGWLPLSLNLGLRRHFTWRFVVADVTQPLIGSDFFSHYGLLVDCKNKRLLTERCHIFVCTCPSSEFADPQCQSHPCKYTSRQHSLRVSRPH
jgi:hypothetical protein